MVALVAPALIPARWAAQFWLARLNQRNVLAHAGSVPEAFRGTVDAATYDKSVAYTLAKGRFSQVEMAHEAVLLAVGAVQRIAAVGLQPRQPASG